MTDTLTHVNCQHAVDPSKPCDCGAGDTTLTATDVRALKHADALCFDHLADGTSRIRAILRAESSPTGFEETRSIAALDARLNDYGPSADGPYTAFAMIGSAKYDAVAQTLIRHLKVGSQFVLVWTRDNNNGYVKDADLHVDTLRVRVQAKGAKVADEFLIAYAVCRDNTARMVRRPS